MRQPYVLPRRRLLVAVWLTLVALPVLAIDNVPRTDARAAPVTAVSADAIDGAITALEGPPTTPDPTTANPAALTPTSTRASTTTATTERPTTTAAPDQTTVVKARPTTTSPPTTSPPATAAPANEQVGGASWYDYRPGECAHPTIAKGTVVTVTALASGASVTCVVTDRGPHGAGRIIDLDRGTFAQLANPNAGVIQVSISW